MEMLHLQDLLFQQVKQKLNSQSSMAESVSKVLGISVDSAYRRVRGETMIDLEETRMLCQHYGISLDALMGLQDDKIIFRGNLSANNEFDFLDYLKGVLANMQYFMSFPDKKLFYECKDIPIFYHFYCREIAAFKYYFWMRFLYQQGTLRYRKFSLDDHPDEIFEVGQQILNAYYSVPSVEFWNMESMNSTLRQIRFFYEIGCFSKKDDAILIIHKLLEFIDHFEHMTAQGIKQPVCGLQPEQAGGTLDVYYNEVILGNNMIVAQLGNNQLTYLNHSVFKYAVTTDSRFSASINHYMNTLMKSSGRLSSTNEIERTAFFATLRSQFNEQIQKIKSSA